MIENRRFNSPAAPPLFCSHCGKPFPWTETAIEQASELLDLIDELSDEQKQTLKASLPDLVADSPRTQVAAIRTGKALARVEAHFREAFKQILFGVIAQKTQDLLKPFGF